MKQKHKRMIREIMANFDYVKVQRVMEFLQWGWAEKIPTVTNIEDTARELLKQCIEDDLKLIQSGGLRVDRVNGNLRLSFEIEDWEAEK